MEYLVVIRKLSDDDGGGYQALVPDLMGCMSDGETPEEAVTNIKLAIADWIEIARNSGRDVPEPGAAKRAALEREAAMSATVEELRGINEELGSRLEGLDSRIERIGNEIEQLKKQGRNRGFEGSWIAAAKPIPGQAGKRLLA